MSKQEDLTKVTIITLLGLAIFVSSLFWLKGYKLHNQQKIKVYFEDVSGLEEGAIVRWSGLRVGVVESICPVLKSTKNKENKNYNELIELGQNELKEAEKLEARFKDIKDKKELKSLKIKFELLKDKSQVHIQQGLADKQQKQKESKNHVEVTLVITKKDVPFGPLSSVNIVPSGLIGEQYVEINPIINRKSGSVQFNPIFISQEPLRFERFLRANIESSEAFRDAITKINKLLQDEDVNLLIATIQDAREVVKNVNKLIDNAGVLLSTTSEKLEQLATSSNLLSTSVVQVGDNINKIIGDEQIIKDLKTTTTSLGIITTQVAKLLDEQGLAKDILQISMTANETSTELSSFIKDLRQTQEELELPKTVSNLNSLSEKLDKLTGELNSIVADKEFKEDIKVTAKKARETSENLQKISKKFNKRFLFFRLLF
ncbi:MAG: MCE family protein [Candidatus Melainabacteria bacterium]|nr:MCE family protein [Candidatus Melainabacteria bacterium]